MLGKGLAALGEYADYIRSEKICQELQRSAGRDDLRDSDVETLVAMCWQVADAVGPLLARIPDTFAQYTDHSIAHSRNVLHLMGRFIPQDTLANLNALELTLLIISSLLHDVGMVVSPEEKLDILQSEPYRSFRADRPDRGVLLEQARNANVESMARVVEDALLAEFIRIRHAERATRYIKDKLKSFLIFRGLTIADAVADLCESHGWGVEESHDPAAPPKSVAGLRVDKHFHSIPVNLQFVACCLRLADIMDFDRSRTPSCVFEYVLFTEAKSLDEWNKHIQVHGWAVTETEVRYEVVCTAPEYYVAVQDFLTWIDTELRDCTRLLSHGRQPRKHYELRLRPLVDRHYVTMADPDCIAGAFRFELDDVEIMRLLMGESLYSDPCLFLRELLQNSLDACRHKEALAKSQGWSEQYRPRIAIWDCTNSKDDPHVIVQDNGMGMSQRIVESYFLRVGKSYYRSSEFAGERLRLREKGISLDAISFFGIGFLACFMVADRIEVETRRHGSDALCLTVSGPNRYWVVRRRRIPKAMEFPRIPKADRDDGPPDHCGTRVTVHLKPGVNVNVRENLTAVAVNVDYDIRVHRGSSGQTRVVKRSTWAKSPNQDSLLASVAGHEDLAYSLEEVIAAVSIPFSKWDFSRGLNGGAWLWLLRDRSGAGCPERGYLRIKNDLELIGPAKMLSVLQGIYEPRSSESIRLAGQLKLSFRPEMLPDNSPRGWFREQWMQLWLSLTDEERATVGSIYEAYAHGDSPGDWLSIPEVPVALLMGELPAATYKSSSVFRRVSHTKGINGPPETQMAYAPQEIAVHGIRVPGNIETLRQNECIIPAPGGCRIDIRGDLVPILSIDRLSISKDRASSFVKPYLRAILRHSWEMCRKHPKDLRWMAWFGHMMHQVSSRLGQICSEDLDYIEPDLPFPCASGKLLTKRQLVKQFGRWVPYSVLIDAERLDGDRSRWLGYENGMPASLSLSFPPYAEFLDRIVKRPRREQSDGKVLLDLGDADC